MGLTTTAARAYRALLVVQEGLNQVTLRSLEQPHQRHVIPVGEKPHEVELSPRGDVAYVSNFGLLEADHKAGTPGTSVSVIDVRARRERTRFALPKGALAPHGLKLRPQHSSELYVNTEEGVEEMVVLDSASGRVLRTFPLPKGMHNFVFSDDGKNLYAFTIADRILRFDAESGGVLAEASVAHVRGLAWTTDRLYLLVGGRGEVLKLSPDDLSIARRWNTLPVGQIFYPAASPDGRWIFAPAVLEGAVLVMDAATGQVQRQIRTGSPLQVIFDGKQAWISNVKVPEAMLPPGAPERPGGVARLDLSSFEFEMVGDLDDANGIALIP